MAFVSRIRKGIGLMLGSVFTRLIAALRLINARTRSDDGVLIGFPSGRGSVGDEAMLISTVQQLRSRGIRNIGVMVFDPGAWDAPPEGLMPVEFLLYPRSLAENVSVLRKTLRFGAFLQIGADVLDGFYQNERTRYRLGFVGTMARAGLRTVILGFSFRSDATPDSVSSIRALPHNVLVCARDPVSKERLERLTGRRIQLVADLAFLLRPKSESPEIQPVVTWIREQQARNRLVCAVNCNYQVLESRTPTLANDFIASHKAVLERILEGRENLAIVLIPHDYRGATSDMEILKSLFSQIPERFRSRILFVDTRLEASEIKGICSTVDCAISGRMHLAIACLGSGVPVACFEYQEKFEGLYAHFGLDSNLLIPGKKALDSSAVLRLSEHLINGIEEHTSVVRSALPKMQTLSHLNFEEIERMTNQPLGDGRSPEAVVSDKSLERQCL